MPYGRLHRIRQWLARERSRLSNYPVVALVLISWGGLFADGLATTRNIPRIVAIAVPLACFAAAIAALVQGFRVRRALQQIPFGHCRACGYNLTANTSGKCPECGKPTPDSPPQLESPPPTT